MLVNATLLCRGVQKNRLNRENRKTNNRKNRTVKKNRLNRLKFWKNRPVRFWFFKPGTGKTEPNRTEKNRAKTEPNRAKTEPNRKNRAKPEKTKPNRAKPVWTVFFSKKPNRTEPKPVGWNRFRFDFGFFLKKNSVWLLFLIKTEPWTPLSQAHQGNIFYTPHKW